MEKLSSQPLNSADAQLDGQEAGAPAQTAGSAGAKGGAQVRSTTKHPVDPAVQSEPGTLGSV